VIPEAFEATKNVPFNPEMPIRLNVIINSTTIRVGEVAKLTYDISNESPKTLKSGKLELLAHARYFAHGANHVKSSTIYTMELKEDFPVLSTSKRNKTIDLHIPPSIEPTLPKEISNIIHLYYEFRITLEIAGLFSGHCQLAVPVLINPIIPIELAHIMPPTNAPTGQVGIMVLPKDDAKYHSQWFYWNPWYSNPGMYKF